MRILICAQKFEAPLVGGVDVYAERLAHALVRQGHVVEILAIDPDGAANQGASIHPPEDRRGLRVHRLVFPLDERSKGVFARGLDETLVSPISEVLRVANPDLFIIMNFYLPSMASVKAAKALGIDVAAIATDFVPICRRGTMMRWNGQPCHSGESLKSCSACFVSQKPSGRVAASVMGLLSERTLLRLAKGRSSYVGLYPHKLLDPYWRELERTEDRITSLGLVRSEIDLVLAPTSLTRALYIQNGFNPQRVKLLPFGVDRDASIAKLSRTRADHIRFLFVGRLQPYKGLHVLVEAFERLRESRGATLDVYGAPGGYPNYTESLINRMKRNASIEFHGQAPPEELGQAFANTDYFVLPSIWHENSPLILLDALQSGTPVIASSVGGVLDLIRDGENGFLFPMGDQKALMEVLHSVIAKPELLSSLRARSGEPLRSIDEYAADLLAMFDDRASVGQTVTA